ncbi:MAG: 16S rRNA (cytosine(967)-C(5))-methyltransferase RsmB [Actinomycetota bacterium]|nr:16S rRNA (cytosine(967)-C(5))-methyltransferase RsmB [Actinomycetota bacterium]
MTARKLALFTLRRIEEEGLFANIYLGRILDESGLNDVDRSLVTELVYGVLRRRTSLDWAIQSFSNREIDSLPKGFLDILRLGAYQLLYLDKIPPSAAVDESVKLTKEEFHQGVASYANAVLRSLARGKENIKLPDRANDVVKYLSVKHSHPRWLVEMWMAELGVSETEALLEANNQRPKVKVRVNLLKTTRSSLIQRLAKAGVSSQESRLVKEGLIILSGPNVAALDDFKEGLFTIQDESSMIVTSILAPKAGDEVLDLCAGQGGKTTHLAEMMGDNGHILALDLNEKRLENLKGVLLRLSLKSVETRVMDATKAASLLKAKFDRVLLDAPCSGLGVLARRPDARWQREPQDIKRLAKLQFDLLVQASKLAKRGSRIVYSVCTISKAETGDLISKFLQRNPDFYLEDLSKRPDTKIFAGDKTVQFLPHKHDLDGMFIASLIKN